LLSRGRRAETEAQLVTTSGWTGRLAAVGLALSLAAAAGSRDDAPAAGDQVLLWHSPGAIEALDLAAGPGGAQGAPRPPFQFVEEVPAGTTPKVKVTDATGRTWVLKWGDEARAELFSARIVWAMGYYVEPTYRVERGQVSGVPPLRRATLRLERSGMFHDARFQLWPRHLSLLGGDRSWRWDDNPFAGSRELNGLKLLMMLLSNWDAKDPRNSESNTGIFVYDTGGRRAFQYAVTDWGASMGRWGGAAERSKWDCAGYAAQTPGFVRGVDAHGEVVFGFTGKHSASLASGIRVQDVAWLAGNLGRLGDGQIRDALRASGAKTDEVECYLRAFRSRVAQLEKVSAGVEPEPPAGVEIQPPPGAETAPPPVPETQPIPGAETAPTPGPETAPTPGPETAPTPGPDNVPPSPVEP
jgi:hypothetical protein